MNGRVYDPYLAKMISADPTVPGAFNSQAFNRYAYVFNNPLKFTDRSGFTPEEDLLNWLGRGLGAVGGATWMAWGYAAIQTEVAIASSALLVTGSGVAAGSLGIFLGGTAIIAGGFVLVDQVAYGGKYTNEAISFMFGTSNSTSLAQMTEAAMMLSRGWGPTTGIEVVAAIARDNRQQRSGDTASAPAAGRSTGAAGGGRGGSPTLPGSSLLMPGSAIASGGYMPPPLGGDTPTCGSRCSIVAPPEGPLCGPGTGRECPVTPDRSSPGTPAPLPDPEDDDDKDDT